MNTIDVFLLTSEWQDFKGRNILKFYGTSNEAGTVEILVDNVKPVFFIKRKDVFTGLNVKYIRKNVKLKNFSGEDVDALYFNTVRDLKTASDFLDSLSITTYEVDVDPVRRYLMERFINVQIHLEGKLLKKDQTLRIVNPKISPCNITPNFKIASIDIETGESNKKLYSIAVHLTGREELKKVFMIGDVDTGLPEQIQFFSTEKNLLENFIIWFNQIDPDIIIGWHVIGFDLMFLEKKCNEYNIPFNIGRGHGRITLRSRKRGGYFANISGRIVIDGPPALRAAFYSFEDYKLETVAQELLSTGKIITPDENKVDEIERLFNKDKVRLAEYNIQDAVLVTEIFKKTGLINLSIKRAVLSGLLMDQLGMMTAAFDHFYLPRLHREGFVAPNVKDLKTTDHAAGGYVIEPVSGIYDDVALLDFKSLYPSIIQTFKIDPLSRLLADEKSILTPGGYKFSSAKNLLPEFIDHLMNKRNEAKKINDKYLSQAIKILMNSFYGVMGSYGCRFYHPDLPSAITGTGQWLLLRSKEYLEEKGYKVVYGDTDSLFVKLKEGEGENADNMGVKLADDLNKYWNLRLLREFDVESHLEIEYEKYYKKYIITPARGAETGAKKRYAGLLVKDGKEKIEFVGLEFVRSDWTRMAKEFQIGLYERVFKNMEVAHWIRDFVAKVKNGEFDNKLIYRKRLRKDIDDYIKNVPPHVKAARMISGSSGTISYVITHRGPVPIDLHPTDLDYDHYIDKQLKPIADSILSLLNESFDAIVHSSQLNFFDN